MRLALVVPAGTQPEQPRDIMDLLVAATALVHNLTLVTMEFAI